MDLVVVFEKFGLPVAMLLVMIWLFVRAEDRSHKERKDHTAERKEWRDSQNDLQKETNKAITELTKAIERSNNN